MTLHIFYFCIRSYSLLLVFLFLEFSTAPLGIERKFPDGFLFGTASSSYQTEGAWEADGKSVNIWDDITHNRPNFVIDGSNGDIADNSYYLYKRDVQMLRELGVDTYRFSLSWTRILPTSFPDQINAAGVEYYNNLIDELLKYNIQPILTIYHWDLPLKLQQLGGWANPHIIDYFADYARIAFQLFGDRVKYWITINEPHQICYFGYGANIYAPALDISGVAEYLCAKNILLAHAKAYHIYDREFRMTFNGIIFISLSAQWYEPRSENEIDTGAAYDANQFNWAQYSHPIFSRTGDFPQVMKERIALKSAAQGFPRSRLPEFTPEEINLVRGSSDLFGLNHYMTIYATRNESVYNLYKSPSFLDDLGVINEIDPNWIIGASNRSIYVPWGFYKLLKQIRTDYDNPPVIITENGFPSLGGIRDHDRITYYNGYLSAMLDAIQEGSDIRGYSAWSLMDNFEWKFGYTLKFGLYEVDFSSVYLTRTALELFGDRVKSWITINEPREVCYQGYGGKSLAPLLDISGYADYMCAKNLLIAHASAYHLYNNEYREAQGGEVGISISARWYEPESEKDAEAAEDSIQFEWGIYANPIFSENGDFPSVMKERVAAKSKAQGFPRSRLPEFSPEEVDFVKGTSDFFGLNHYTTSIIYRNASVNGYYVSPSFYDDIETISYQDREWKKGASDWLKVVPWGFYKLLTKIREDYNNPPVYVTENGFSCQGGLVDDLRVEYYRTYIDAMLDAVEDGSDVRVYSPWSLMDNFEWLKGYTERFGLYEVDYESPERTRTPRKSAYVYKEILRTRTLDFDYEPDMSVPMSIENN